MTIQKTVAEYFQKLSDLMLAIEVTDRSGTSLGLIEGTQEAVRLLTEVRSSNRKVMLAGNGGSSAIVTHAQSDLSGGAGVRALVFTEPPLLSATANDFGYGSVFERPIQLWAETGDMLYTVSSSGKSENIVRGLEAATDKGCRTITLSGFSPENPSRRMGDLNFYVRSDVYGLVESAHTALTHFLTTGLPAPAHPTGEAK